MPEVSHKHELGCGCWNAGGQSRKWLVGNTRPDFKFWRELSSYIAELGTSAYTSLNVATEFATQSPSVTGKFATTAGLQEIIGQRMRIISDRSDEISKLVEPELALLLTA